MIGPPIKFASEDLTMREVSEAKTWGLTPGQYVNFRHQLLEKYGQAHLKGLRIEIEKEIGDTARENAVKAIRAEWEAGAVTPTQREAARDFLRDLEIDARTHAETASQLVAAARRRFAVTRWIRQTLFYILMLGALPFMFTLYAAGLHFNNWGLYALMTPWVTAFFVLMSTNGSCYEDLSEKVNVPSAQLSEYMHVASLAREDRLVQIDLLLTRGALKERLGVITSKKTDVDRRFRPDTRALQRARIVVQDDIATALDAERLISSDDALRQRIAEAADQVAELETIERSSA